MKHCKNIVTTINIAKKRKIVAFFTIIFSIFAFLSLYFHFIVTPLLIRTSEAQMKVFANKSMDYAVTEAMSSFVTYDDLIKITRDNSGNIKTMQANSVKVNNISRMVTQIALSYLSEIGNEPLKISLGAFTGITIFSSIGPKVEITIHPYGDYSCYFTSEFLDAGINQTQHKIYMNISAIIRVVFPIKTVEIKSSSDVLVTEGVIIGEIPETYLKSNTLTEMLNLVP